MLTAQLEITVYFPCVRLAFHVSKCFIAVLRLQLTAGSDVLEQQTIVACVFLGKLIKKLLFILNQSTNFFLN
jgi:hypothetical protein